MKAVLCIPTMTKPHPATLASVAASVPLLDAAGINHAMVSEVGCPYVSAARATMLRKALSAGADAVIFIDHDVSWKPADLLTLIQAEGDYVFGTYRFKREPEEYMGKPLTDEFGDVIVRESDGALQAFCGPAGFLKITSHAVNLMMQRHPELCYGERHTPHFDFFQHGAHNHVWYGEDYAASRRWIEAGQSMWLLPGLDITHHSADTAYPGNYARFLRRQPGGDLFDGA